MFRIYDKNETNFETFGLAVLKNIKNPLIKRKINSIYELTFEYLIEQGDDKLQYIEKENIIKADGQLFRITEIEKVDTGYTQHLKITAPHIFFDLIDYYTEDRRAVNVSVQTALEILLQDTPFRVGQCDDLGVNTAYFIEENKLKSINDKIIPRWNCEIEIDGFTVTAKRRIGQDRKYHIRRGKNLKGVNYIEDITGVITRLYVKGKDGLTIESVNNGKKYIDSPLIDNYSHPKAGEVKFENIEDPQELLQAGQEHLEKVDKPYIHYNIDLVELRDSEQYRHFKDLEKFDLGDTCYVYNARLGIDIEARILEYHYNPIRRQNSVVVLGNFTNRIEDILGQFEDTKRKTDNSITDDGYVRTNWLQGEINALVNRIIASGAYQHAEVVEGGGLLFENTDETSQDFGALYIGPGIFAIADSKKADNTWNWRTFGTGSGFVADYIIAGVLKGGKVHFDLTNGTFLIGNNIEDYNLYFDGSNLSIKLSNNKSIETALTELETGLQDYADQAANQAIDNIQIGGRNLLWNSDFSKTYKGNPFSVDGKTYDTYPSQWVAYNSGIDNPTTNYHAHIDDDTFGFNVVEFNETNGQRNWKAIHQSGLEERLSPTQTGIFTFSVDVYATGTGTRLFGGFYYYRKSDGERGFHSGQFNIEPTEINKWVRMSAQCRLNNDVDFSKTILFYIYGFNFTTNSILYIKNVKLEYGNKATDWTLAPEDTVELIDNTAARIEEQVAELAVSLDGITSEVSTVVTEMDGLREYTETLVQQTSSELSVQITDSLSSLEEDLIQRLQANIQATAEDLLLTFTGFQNSLEGLSEDIANFQTTFRLSGEGLEIGRAEDPFKLFLTNNKMSILDSGSEVAYVSDRKMFITEAEITNSFKVGNHLIETYNDEITLVRWVG